MQGLKLYCQVCNGDLIMHADGSIACECNELWRVGDRVPRAWVDNLQDHVEPATLANWIEFAELGS